MTRRGGRGAYKKKIWLNNSGADRPHHPRPEEVLREVEDRTPPRRIAEAMARPPELVELVWRPAVCREPVDCAMCREPIGRGQPCYRVQKGSGPQPTRSRNRLLCRWCGKEITGTGEFLTG